MEHGVAAAVDLKLDGWEASNFPILCETCLGDNPYVRMIRCHGAKECKICSRPYTGFRWQPGRKARYKTTIVCQSCARLKNVCQTCLFDLEYGLPVQVRDKFMEASQLVDLPDSRVNRDYMLQGIPTSAAIGPLSSGSTGNALITNSSSAAAPYSTGDPHPILLRLARLRPYYKRNQARICTFWMRGACARGEACPYRHEIDEQHSSELANQDIRDRYHGVNDPVADKILKAAAASASSKPASLTDVAQQQQPPPPPSPSPTTSIMQPGGTAQIPAPLVQPFYIPPLVPAPRDDVVFSSSGECEGNHTEDGGITDCQKQPPQPARPPPPLG
jgi:pre-mRNA-splicing factor RBM22/SLT11